MSQKKSLIIINICCITDPDGIRNHDLGHLPPLMLPWQNYNNDRKKNSLKLTLKHSHAQNNFLEQTIMASVVETVALGFCFIRS